MEDEINRTGQRKFGCDVVNIQVSITSSPNLGECGREKETSVYVSLEIQSWAFMLFFLVNQYLFAIFYNISIQIQHTLSKIPKESKDRLCI